MFAGHARSSASSSIAKSSTVTTRMKSLSYGIALGTGPKIWLANAGYDPQYGARPLKRVIQKEVQNKMASYLLKQEEMTGSEIFIDEKDGGLVLFPFEQ